MIRMASQLAIANPTIATVHSSTRRHCHRVRVENRFQTRLTEPPTQRCVFGSASRCLRPSSPSATGAAGGGRRGRQTVVAAGRTVGPITDVPKAFKKLQNGSDMRGVALEGVPGQEVNLTEGKAFYVGAAFADWLIQNATTPGALEDAGLAIAIGMDPRLSGMALGKALIAGLVVASGEAVVFGLATTPAMFMSTITPPFLMTGAIMITASHLPFNRNGFKFFTANGGLEKKDISWILDKAAELCIEAGGDPDDLDAGMDHFGGPNCKATFVEANFMEVYANQLKMIIKEGVKHPTQFDRPLEGFKIVVDAGNGSGGFFATNVLEPLGADITGSQFLDPDGTFPNHIPNPEEATAMASTTKAVLDNKADLGICFDTDVDRSGVVDSTGRQINSNLYIALMAAITLQDYPGTTIVTDSVTSNGLTKFITQLGGKHFRYRRGYKNVIGKGMDLNEEGEVCELMMETSGHGAMKENFFLDDGAYSAVKTIIQMVRLRLAGKGTISEMLDQLEEPLESREYRLAIKGEDFQEIGKQVLADFHDMVQSGEQEGWSLEEVNHEGWRVNVDEGDGRVGWILLRQSLHDPLLVCNIESEVECGATNSAFALANFMKKFDNVDSGSLLVDMDSCVKSGGWDGVQGS